MAVEHHEAAQGHYQHTPEVKIALHHDEVAPEAVGGLYEHMPKGYYLSSGFIGTMTVGFLVQKMG
jgi:hypothetical protein